MQLLVFDDKYFFVKKYTLNLFLTPTNWSQAEKIEVKIAIQGLFYKNMQ